VRVFVLGASGVIGARLVPLLVDAGHDVAGLTRTPAKVDRLREQGAEPVVCNVFDLEGLREALITFGPDLVLSQLTDMPDDRGRLPEQAEAMRRMCRVGTHNMVAAARDADAERLIAQSVAWSLPGENGMAVEDHERAVLAEGGLVIRYGRFFGRGTYFTAELPPEPRIHVNEAARRTMAALDTAGGVIVVAEDPPE
jgi:nucleoside-diphosphate-sugar epimerase